jgi:hypothetical protein
MTLLATEANAWVAAEAGITSGPARQGGIAVSPGPFDCAQGRLR